MAYDFVPASDQYISASNPVSAAPFTVSCWGYLDNRNANRALLSIGRNTSAIRWVLYNQGDATNSYLAWAAVDAGGVGQATTTAQTSNSTWFHAAARESSATDRKVYLNGSDTATNATSRTPTSVVAINVGADFVNNSRSSRWDGKIAEVAVWNAALSDAEIESLSDGIRASLVRPQSLVFYAPLVRDLADYARGITLTNNNTATVDVHPRRIA